MLKLNEEYFMEPYYFFLKEKGDKVAVYYSVSNTLAESRKEDDVIEVDKEVFEEIQKLISKILKSGKKLSKEQVHKLIDSKSKKKETDGEIEELVDPDGSIISSSIPILNQRNLAKKTMDQTVRMTKANQFPFIRIYYGESEEGKGNTISEVDQSESFGFEETEDMDFKNTVNTLKKMGVENAVHRAKELGKLPKAKKRNGKLRQRLSEKDSIEEQERQKMVKMVEDILAKKSNKDSDILKKDNDSGVSKILVKNLQSIKKLADKEGISISKLINILKTSE
jgi:hypothetical protein